MHLALRVVNTTDWESKRGFKNTSAMAHTMSSPSSSTEPLMGSCGEGARKGLRTEQQHGGQMRAIRVCVEGHMRVGTGREGALIMAVEWAH